MFVRKGVGLITSPFLFKNILYICPMTYTEDIDRFRKLQTEALQKRVEELEIKIEILTQQIKEYDLYK